MKFYWLILLAMFAFLGCESTTTSSTHDRLTDTPGGMPELEVDEVVNVISDFPRVPGDEHKGEIQYMVIEPGIVCFDLECFFSETEGLDQDTSVRIYYPAQRVEKSTVGRIKGIFLP